MNNKDEILEIIKNSSKYALRSKFWNITRHDDKLKQILEDLESMFPIMSDKFKERYFFEL